MNYSDLAKPFLDDDLEWRISQVFNKTKLSARVLVYVTNRAIMNRLDEICGPENWKNEYTQLQGAFLCGLSIKCGSEWVTKWDGAQESNIEATKGGLSGAMKRAAVQWGIGRYLYSVGDFWADINDNGKNYQSAKGSEYPAFKWNAPRLGDQQRTPPQGQTPQSSSQPSSGSSQGNSDKPWFNDFSKHKDDMVDRIASGEQTARQIIDALAEKYKLSKKTKEDIMALEL